MIVGTAEKQPIEKKSYSVNYSGSLHDGDTLKTVTTSVDIPGLVVSDASVYSPRVKLWVEGGEHLRTYRIEITVTTNHGAIFQDELIVKVKET